MRKFIILASSLLALAIPAAGIASVAVENGVGYVGKGDVQTALGWNNAAFDKGAGSLKFTAERREGHRRLPDVLLQRLTQRR